MNNNKIAFFKILSPLDNKFPLRVRDDHKYDNHPLINKEAINEAIEEYDERLHYTKGGTYFDVSKLNLNIEGRFLAENIPEIPSIVIDEVCTKKILHKTLKKHDITHIALSTYVSGLDKAIEIIKIIQSEYRDKEMYIGGVGAVYPHLQELVNPENICVGNGVNWLRHKFNLKPFRTEEFRIPEIIGDFPGFPIPVKTSYLITQIGCTSNCDFCITTNLLKYQPFCSHERIINLIEDLSSRSKKDIFLFINEPNAFFPEVTWKKVFEHFINNRRNFDNSIFIAFDGSLNHINKFDLESIQTKSPLKFMLISFGIESTLEGGYPKNQGNPKKVIERLNKLGIITKQNYILGLPFHKKKTVDIDIGNNLKYNSDIYAISNFVPIPLTPLYNQLELEKRHYDRTLPPEFLYSYGFQPFHHEYLGGGFNVLKYLFKALYESEKKLVSIFGNFTNKLMDLFSISNSRKIKWVADIFLKLDKLYLKSFQTRMNDDLIVNYRQRFEKTRERYRNL
ncbi:MAG: hypothetical protein ACXADU_00155 [Promethearchaeota archaeon]|jgi:hypothetical protein